MAEISSSYKLELDQPKKNVFVTQLGNQREEDEEDVNRYHVVKESANKLIESGLNTRQKTLLLKRQVEVDEVHEELMKKKDEFQTRMKSCTEKRREIQLKQLKFKQRVEKFEKFIRENEAKRLRAIQKYQTEQKQNDRLAKEYHELCEQLEQLKIRHQHLVKKVARYKIYEHFMTRVTDSMPENYLEVSDSMIHSCMMRHWTLSATHKGLVGNMTQLSDKLKANQQKFEEMKYNHNQRKLLINQELAELQQRHEGLIEHNKEMEQIILDEKHHLRQQYLEFGQIVLALRNLSDKCTKKLEKPIEKVDYDAMLKRVEAFFVERIDVDRMARMGVIDSPTPSQGTQNSPQTKVNRHDSHPKSRRKTKSAESPNRGKTSHAHSNHK